MPNEVAVIRDYDIRDRKLVDATAQSTINSTDAIEMKTTDGNQVFIDKASFIKAVGQAFTASDPKTFTKLLGMNGDGPMGIGASDLASVLGVGGELQLDPYDFNSNGSNGIYHIQCNSTPSNAPFNSSSPYRGYLIVYGRFIDVYCVQIYFECYCPTYLGRVFVRVSHGGGWQPWKEL